MQFENPSGFRESQTVLFIFFMTACIIYYCLGLRHPPREGVGAEKHPDIQIDRHTHGHCELGLNLPRTYQEREEEKTFKKVYHKSLTKCTKVC